MSRHSVPSRLSDPVSPFFQSFQKEMSDWIDQFRQNRFEPKFNGGLMPAIDMAETDEAVEISAEIPGVAEDDLDVSVTGDALVLKGEKSAAHEEKEKDYVLVERNYGSFRRQIPLGFTPEAGAVKAEFHDGVLTVKIKKPPQAKVGVQKISINKS